MQKEPFFNSLLVAPVVRLHLPDGTAERVRVGHFVPTIGLNTPNLRLAEEFRWLGERPPTNAHTHNVAIDLSPSQRDALARGEARLVLQGHVEVREPRVAAALPLSPGATAVSQGRRVRIVSVERVVEEPTVELHISTVSSSQTPTDPESAGPFGRAAAFAPVNHERGEALAIIARSSSGGGFGLVLPGPDASVQNVHLGPGSFLPHRGAPEVRTEEEWLRGARLLLIQWVPLGSYPVTLEADRWSTGRFLEGP